MAKDITLKFFILDSAIGNTTAKILKTTAEFNKIPINVEVSMNKNTFKLPKGYDSYLIHLSDTCIVAIEELKIAQPWSKVYAASGGLSDGIIAEKTNAFYRHKKKDMEKILKETKEIYTKKLPN